MSDRESDLSSLLSSATLVALGSVLGAASKMVERIVIGRSLSVDAYGEVSIGMAFLTIASTFAILGFSQGVPRYVARADTRREQRGVWLFGLSTTLVAAAVLTTVLVLGAGTIAEYIGRPDAARLLQLFFVTIPLTVGLRIGIGGIQGLENTRYRTLVGDIFYPVTRIGLLVVFLWAGYETLSAGYAYLLAAGLSFVGAHLLLNRLLPLVGAFEVNPREVLAFSLPIVISGFLAILLSQTDTLMVGYFRTTEEVALYSAAFPIAIGLGALLSAFNFLYLPIASRLDADGEHDEIAAIYAVTTKWAFFLTFPAFLTFAVYSGDVLAVLFGERYRPASLALTILTVGYFSNALFGQNLPTISALGQTKFLAVTNSIAFSVNLGLNLLLIPRYGYVGASVASAVSYTTLNVVANVVLWRRFSISPFTPWAIRTYLPLVVLGPVVLWVLSPWVSITALTLLPFLFCVGVGAVVVAALFGGLQPEDRVLLEYFERLVGRRIPLVRRYLPAEPDDSPFSQ